MELSSGSISTYSTRHYQHSEKTGNGAITRGLNIPLNYIRFEIEALTIHPPLGELCPTFAHRAALPFRHIVSFAVQLPTLSSEADGDAPLASTESTVVHSKHVSVVILHAVEYAGWLSFCRESRQTRHGERACLLGPHPQTRGYT